MIKAPRKKSGEHQAPKRGISSPVLPPLQTEDEFFGRLLLSKNNDNIKKALDLLSQKFAESPFPVEKLSDDAIQEILSFPGKKDLCDPTFDLLAQFSRHDHNYTKKFMNRGLLSVVSNALESYGQQISLVSPLYLLSLEINQSEDSFIFLIDRKIIDILLDAINNPTTSIKCQKSGLKFVYMIMDSPFLTSSNDIPNVIYKITSFLANADPSTYKLVFKVLNYAFSNLDDFEQIADLSLDEFQEKTLDILEDADPKLIAVITEFLSSITFINEDFTMSFINNGMFDSFIELLQNYDTTEEVKQEIIRICANCAVSPDEAREAIIESSLAEAVFCLIKESYSDITLNECLKLFQNLLNLDYQPNRPTIGMFIVDEFKFCDHLGRILCESKNDEIIARCLQTLANIIRLSTACHRADCPSIALIKQPKYLTKIVEFTKNSDPDISSTAQVLLEKKRELQNAN